MHLDLMAIVRSAKADRSAIDLAMQLAGQSDGFVTGLVIAWTPSPPAFVEGFAIDPRWGDLVELTRKELEAERLKVETILRGMDRTSCRSALLQGGVADREVAVNARHADMAVISRPHGPSLDSQMWLVETVVFNSGRPTMLSPPGWKPSPVGRRVTVAWNASREGARAVGDALPLLQAAEKVAIVTVDAEPAVFGHGDVPGADLAVHLARHGVDVEVRNVASTGRSACDAILDDARSFGADMVVMGAYGRPRMQEWIFGGATRDMLQTCPLPLFLAH